MIFNYEKIRNDKEYYKLVIIIHIMAYLPFIIKLKEKNWSLKFTETGDTTGVIIFITISLIISIIEHKKK